MGDLAAQLTGLYTTVLDGFQSVEERVDDLEIQIADGFENIDEQIQDLGDRMETGYEDLNSRFDDVEDRFDQVDAGLSAVHKQASQNRRALATLSDSVTKVQLQVMSNSEALKDISEKVRTSQFLINCSPNHQYPMIRKILLGSARLWQIF